MTVPFLLCLLAEKIASVIQKLDDYQNKHHDCRFSIPANLDEETKVNINAPDYLEEQEMEREREMRQKPHTGHPGRVV